MVVIYSALLAMALSSVEVPRRPLSRDVIRGLVEVMPCYRAEY